MSTTVAFVGAGPTTIYTLNALIAQATRPFALTIFEDQPTVGRGTPYRPGWNDPAMLSNIASIEIPPIEQTLFGWMECQSPARLAALGIDPEGIDERTFYPRVALGAFFHDQLQALIARARGQGIEVTVRTSCRVRDAISGPDGMTLIVQPRRGEPYEARFDHVVLATGHQWPAAPEVRPGYFLSPWPATALAQVAPTSVGMRGSSLTAIDATVALAVTHGTFEEDGQRLRYVPHPGTEGFHITMLSRKGLLPEADFWFPIPYEPLTLCTPEAIDALIDEAPADILDRAFALFKAELTAADPGYARDIGLPDLGIADFCDRYFDARRDVDPFDWAEINLQEAERNYAARHTVPWRYAILRMHEVLERLVPFLDDDDFLRFSRCLKPMFVDDYATVPHESIKRLLALHAAGKLSVRAVGDRYRIDSHVPDGGAILHHEGTRTHFPVFVEAMGQRALPAKEFPFASLRAQGIVRDAGAAGEGPCRGIVIDDEYHPIADDIPRDQLFCLSLPFLMGRHPFIQGITSSHEMGQVVGARLAEAIARADAIAETVD